MTEMAPALLVDVVCWFGDASVATPSKVRPHPVLPAPWTYTRGVFGEWIALCPEHAHLATTESEE